MPVYVRYFVVLVDQVKAPQPGVKANASPALLALSAQY